MRTNEPDCALKGAEPREDSARAIRLINKIKKRYGLAQVDSVSPALAAEPPVNDSAYLESAVARLTEDQMQVNAALVAKIFQCQRAEEALRASEQRLHDLLNHQLRAKEEERKRISREIHDTLGQNLLALRMDVATLHLHTSPRHQRMHAWVAAALDNLDGTIRAVRNLIADLRPFQVELGLEAAIEWELNKFKRSSGLACHLDIDAGVADLSMSDEQTLAVYRTLQECLNNIFRHSLATRVDVALTTMSGKFLMSVSDNGVGYDPAAQRKSSAYGLLAIRERLASLGGELALTSAKLHGTTVSIAIPAARAG